MRTFFVRFLAVVVIAVTAFSSMPVFASRENIYIDEVWQSNTAPIIYPINVEELEESEDTLFEESLSKEEPEEWVYKVLTTVKEEIQAYFIDNYDLDCSKKLDKLKKIYVFSGGDFAENEQYYISAFVNEINEVRINNTLLEDTELLECNLVHEVLHYLGIKDEKLYYISEGLTDALAADVMDYVGKDYIASDYYLLPMLLSEQILTVYTDFVKEMIEKDNFSLSDFFNNQFEGVEQVYGHVEDLALELEACIGMFIEDQYEYTDEVPILFMQAQILNIVLCRTFTPTKFEIEKVREQYIYEEAELLFVEPVYFIDEGPDFLDL